MKTSFNKAELVLLLKQQLSAIEQLCVLYDSGHHFLACDIAVKLRVIFHNTDVSTSLIRHLKLDHILMCDTALKYDSKSGLIVHSGLTMMSFRQGKTACFSPTRSSTLNKVPLSNWWSNKKIIVDTNGNSYTRKNLVLLISNKDGGAHVADYIDQGYYALTRGNSSGWIYSSADGSVASTMNPVPASIRQIAHEVMDTYRTLVIANESNLRQ